MKILHIAQFLGIGGLEKVLLLLAKKQQEAGHQVDICIYDHERTWVEYFKSQGLNIITPPLKKAGYDLTLLKTLNQLVSGYDIIHSHDLNPLMYLAPLKVFNKLQFKFFPKLIHTTHGMDHVKNDKRGHLYEKLMAPFASELVGVSAHIEKFYLGIIGTRKSRVHRIDNGIDVPTDIPSMDLQWREKNRQWLHTEFKIETQNKVIWSVIARVVPLKDQRTIIKAAAKLENVELLIVGPSGDDQYYEQLKINKAKNIHLLGAQSKINEILGASDYFVSGSTHEGIPMSVLEAMAQGVPCLLSDIPGHRILFEQADAGEVGKLFETGNADALIAIFQLMQKDQELKRGCIQQAYNEVLENYSSQKMYLEYLTLYQRGEKC